jgi:hypothetical protein
MDRVPLIGYRAWYSYLRAMMLLGISPARRSLMDLVIAFSRSSSTRTSVRSPSRPGSADSHGEPVEGPFEHVDGGRCGAEDEVADHACRPKGHRFGPVHRRSGLRPIQGRKPPSNIIRAHDPSLFRARVAHRDFLSNWKPDP